MFFLDLGAVEVMAEVIVNGVNKGIFWSRPYLIDVTDVLKPGENTLEIKVTNQWTNRLIGDEQLPEENEYVPGVRSKWNCCFEPWGYQKATGLV